MNKQELTIIVILFALLLGWGYFQRTRLTPPPAGKPESGIAAEQTTEEGVESRVDAEEVVSVIAERKEPLEPVTGDDGHIAPEETIVLSNDVANITVSSWGGGITSVELRNYRAAVDKDSGPVCLDFSDKPALSFTGVPGLSINNDFKISLSGAGNSVNIEKTMVLGLRLERTIMIGEGYQLNVKDVISNNSAVPVELPKHGLGIGPMQVIQTKARTRRGYSYLGLDTLPSAGGAKVINWARKGLGSNDANLAERFQPEHRRGLGWRGCMSKPKLAEPLPSTINVVKSIDTDWVAAKNKFFVQILVPKDGGSGFGLNAKRVVPETEDSDNSRTWAQAASLAEVSADIRFGGKVLQPGESLTRVMNYYVGPKKYSILKQLGKRQDEIMLFAWWEWFRGLCIVLLWTLNAIHKVIPNFGVAIIVLTVIVKFVFWPITRKSTESMKKMQTIQPLVNEIREKHKDKPQKMNQEVMALYKKHKVNPMMGCLPMLVQIPVFIALFTVLRSAVDLRFASFLWIKDLSEPEGLLEGMIPFVGSLNILPLLMTATTILQQKLTPTAGDPQQQKMMAIMMPVVFLFLLYNMASALVLYWTVSQFLSAAQMLLHRRKTVDR